MVFPTLDIQDTQDPSFHHQREGGFCFRLRQTIYGSEIRVFCHVFGNMLIAVLCSGADQAGAYLEIEIVELRVDFVIP